MGALKKESSASQTRTDNVNVVPLPSTAERAGSPGFTVSSSSSDPTASESATASLHSPNIHINHVHVYNVTPGHFKRPEKFRSPAASSGPICRICHEGDSKEDLVSPCRCTGTVGLVHLSCMERWLSTRCNGNDKCELCNYTFATVRYPKSVLEWIRSDENDESNRRSLIGDATCFILLTPLAIVSSFLCVVGAKRQVLWGNSLEAGCLMALATFLITIYFVWNTLTFRYHLKCYLIWRSSNHNVKLVRVQRLSTGIEGRRNYSSPQDIQSARDATSRSCIISIPVFDEIDGMSSSSNRPTYGSHPAEV